MVCLASVAVVTAVRVVALKVGVAGSGTALAMGFGVCSPPQGYSERESLHMSGDRQRRTSQMRQTTTTIISFSYNNLNKKEKM